MMWPLNILGFLGCISCCCLQSLQTDHEHRASGTRDSAVFISFAAYPNSWNAGFSSGDRKMCWLLFTWIWEQDLISKAFSVLLFCLVWFLSIRPSFPLCCRKPGLHWVMMLLSFNLAINYLHGFPLTDVLMVILQTVVLFVYLCKENTPSMSSQTAKLQRWPQVTPPGAGRGNEHREARLVIWPGTMAHCLLSPDVHFTHRAAFVSAC